MGTGHTAYRVLGVGSGWLVPLGPPYGIITQTYFYNVGEGNSLGPHIWRCCHSIKGALERREILPLEHPAQV